MPAPAVKHRMRKEIALDTDVLTEARRRMRYAYEQFDHITVAFSGGKDSTVALEIALEEAERTGRLPLDVVFFDEEAIPYPTEEYVRRRAQDPRISMRWYCLPVQHFNACSRAEPWWWPWDPEKQDLWVRPMPEEAITTLDGFPLQPPEARLSIPNTNALTAPPELGQVGLVMGIRADESLTRRRALLQRDVDPFIVQIRGKYDHGNAWKVYPVYDFTTSDIWRAIAQQGWDYNTCYDDMEMAAIPPLHQRCAPPYGTEPMQSLWRFARCWPDVWDRMAARVRGADTAARYARTELYSHGSFVKKPDDVSWEQFLIYYLRKFSPDLQRITALRLKGEIGAHYSRTTDPILDATPHPDTGLSWKFLFQLASRSDPKGRKIALAKVSGDPIVRAQHRERWELERTYLIETGQLDPRRRAGSFAPAQASTADQERAMQDALDTADAAAAEQPDPDHLPTATLDDLETA